ncbi:hypothetical protein DFQ26_007840 [Actinomortierella ambigua]|nr:hypothetical protein DFQ26_007840 [Actinomortierella ambigua]
MTQPITESGAGVEVVDSVARSDITPSVPDSHERGSSLATALKRTLSYREEDEETSSNQRADEGDAVSKRLKQDVKDEPIAASSSSNGEQKQEAKDEEEEEELDYEVQRQRNILENQRILAELGLDSGLGITGMTPFHSGASMQRPPAASAHGHRHRSHRRRQAEAASDDEFVGQEEDHGVDGKAGSRRYTGSSTKMKLLKDAQPVQLRQSMRLRGFKAPETKGVQSDTDDEEELTDDSDNGTKKSKKLRKRKGYEEKQWRTRNQGVQDALPSEQKLVARSAWRGRKQLTGFMIELELPDNISAPLTLRSIATTIWEMGKIYDGTTNKLSYWSGNGSLYKHPYPVGFKAEKQYFGSTFAMEIQATDSGPEFIVRNMHNGQTFRGPSPTQPWTKACLASHSKGTRISGPLFFGFSDPLLQKMIEKLDGYRRWSAVCAEMEREKLGLSPLPTPNVAETPSDPMKAQAAEQDTRDENTQSSQDGPNGGELTAALPTDLTTQAIEE